MKKYILKIDGAFLAFMGTLAGIGDLASYFTGKGPFGKTYFQNPITIGGFEAHSLAVIAGLILIIKSKSSDTVFFCKIAIAIHTILGVSNLIWFKIFFETNAITMGYVTTIVHFTLVGLNLFSIYRDNKVSSQKQVYTLQ